MDWLFNAYWIVRLLAGAIALLVLVLLPITTVFRK